MRCASCQHDNPAGMSFCEQCGSKFVHACPSCGHEVQPTAKFCGKCGTALPAPAQTAQLAETPDTTQQGGRAAVAPRTAEAERRQLTVMFCDLVGSTALAAQLDPEEWRTLVHEYQHTCAQVVQRFEGYIAQYLGDGLLVYFGYPAAHEDDAYRAARTGLEIVAALQALHVHLPHALQVRIGIHTGLVVVGATGSGDRRELLALGETPNIAARLQSLAEPGTVVMSAATYRLTAGLLDCQDLGLQALKGLSTPIPVYRVVGESGKHSRLEVAATTGLTPLVGRVEEVELLLRRWEQAADGSGQVILLSGEPGIGKSRLVHVLTERLAGAVYMRSEWRCSPYHQHSALSPVIEYLQWLLQVRSEDTPVVKLTKLEEKLARYGFPLSDAVPLLAPLLSLPLPERYPPLTMTPQRQKERMLETIAAWLLREAERQPVLMIVEDLHWIDPSTLELLGLLIDHVPTVRLLLLLTHRPEFTPPWASRSHLTQLTLSRLGRTQAEVMVEQVTAGKALPREVFHQIVAKTDGVPLFVEELTKSVIESMESVGSMGSVGSIRSDDQKSLPSFAIPATLHDSLMARLDRLGPAKEIAQVGATLGREFSYELLRAVWPLDEERLRQDLRQLVKAELLYQRGVLPQARYLFKHALIQDTAYQSLLKSTRQQYHQQIAQVLAERFPETTETHPELLAHHYTEAGLIVQAIPYWQQAGQKAVQRSANVEAVNHLAKGLELLKTLPDTPERAQQELALQIALGGPLMVTKGWADPEVESTYTRAHELCRQVGETPQLFPVLVGLVGFYSLRAKLQIVQELAAQCLILAQRVQDPALLLEAYHQLGGTSLYIGELAAAHSYLEQGSALYDPRQHGFHTFLYAHDPGVCCLSQDAFALWLLGYPNQALKRMHQALGLAQELSYPVNLALAQYYAAWFHQYRQEVRGVQERAEACITLCTEQGFPFSLLGTILRGWALAEQGQAEEGIAQIRQGLAALRAAGSELWRPYHLALLAEAYGKVGQAEEGLSALAEAFAQVDKTGERLYEAELSRLKGELLLKKAEVRSQNSESSPQHLAPSTQTEAEACLLKAIEIARKQRAKSLELRAVMSLARLWQSQGKKEEARKLLAEIYGWFTEGFDTTDLQEAKVLLEHLA